MQRKKEENRSSQIRGRERENISVGTTGRTRGTTTGRTSTPGRTSAAGRMTTTGRTSAAGRITTSGRTNAAGRTSAAGRTTTPGRTSATERTEERFPSTEKEDTKETRKAKKKREKKSEKERNKKGNKKSKKIIKTIFLEIFVLFLFTILFIALVCYQRYGKEILALRDSARQMIKYSGIDDFKQAETSLIYDTYGNEITSLKAEKDVYYLSDSEIPQYFKDAMIAVEDKKFYEHPGYDSKAILRAFKSLVTKKGEITQGASTITQQLARNVYLSHEVSWERKIEEIFLAVELEKKYSKEQILEFYLNNIYFANGYYGVEAASQGYFQCSAKDLSISQVAFLCAIPNNPTVYNPLTNFENTMSRRDFILGEMHSEGKISDLDYEISMREEVVLNPKEEKNINNYVETYVFDCAAKALMQYHGFVFQYQFDSDEARTNYEERYQELYIRCLRSLYEDGYRIYTSIDLQKQELLQAALDEGLSANQELKEDGIYALQGSATCIDNATGKVVAIVGGRSQEISGNSLNRAFQSYRQPGSSIKPLVVYTPAFERGYTPDTIVVDEPIEDGPKNAGSYSGAITIRTAVQYSKNTIAHKIFKALTPKVGMQYILNMGFSKIMTQDTYNMASALGGLTYGVTTEEMAAAYSTIEYDGVYRDPNCIVEIRDAQGTVLIPNEWKEIRIYDRNACRMMTDVMITVVTSGTGKGCALTGMPCAGKTGTTNEEKDGWFVGYTPYYTTAVWVGFDIPKTISTLDSTTSPGKIWKIYMQQIHTGLAPKEFPAYTPMQSLIKDETTQLNTEEVTTEILTSEEPSTIDQSTQKAGTTEITTQAPTEETKGTQEATQDATPNTSQNPAEHTEQNTTPNTSQNPAENTEENTIQNTSRNPAEHTE